ncbi:LacI family DNA-binding transcriptional regulator [Actinoplanes sp. NPDC051470]|uniref:LacI family DNA-binding transcriptional regulator n=1 Tax=Actinoplanes sp. NPDC051470 TaxID=3157224 RepID=UPI00341F73F0
MPADRRRRSTQVTIREVAAASGVSVSTVSNLLNGRTAAMTSRTRERIEEAMRSLGYRPSRIAQSLTTKRTRTIGLVIDEISTNLFLAALTAIEPRARQSDRNLVVCHASSAQEEAAVVEVLMQQQVDGIIFLSTSQFRDDSHLAALTDQGMPAVLINRGQANPSFCEISWDNAEGVAAAVDHLYHRGHRRIGHLYGPAGRRSTEDRIAGYRSAMSRHGLVVDEHLLAQADYTEPASRWTQVASDMLGSERRPTAVIAADDTVAAVVLQVAAGLGLRVPQDLAVVGIDDQHFAALLVPPLTTVSLPIAEAATRAFDMLLNRLDDPGLAPERLRLPASLTTRGSA